MTLRIALIDETGEFTVNGQRCKVVPVEPTLSMQYAFIDAMSNDGPKFPPCYTAMLSAAAIDLSGLPRAEGDWSTLFDGAAK